MSHRHARGRGFSLAEVLIALTITATLLTATLAALDASFKSYQHTSESASTNVIARIVMQRVTAMVRTGDQFGPYPVNPILEPTIESDFLEFVSHVDPVTGWQDVIRLERRATGDADAPFELWYRLTELDDLGDIASQTDALLLDGLTELNFVLEYDVGPRLRRATIDMVILPDDLEDAAIAAGMDSPAIRLIASASPRGED